MIALIYIKLNLLGFFFDYGIYRAIVLTLYCVCVFLFVCCCFFLGGGVLLCVCFLFFLGGEGG